MFRQNAGFIQSPRKILKIVYVQDSNCSMENSDFCDLSEEEIAWIQVKSITAAGITKG